MENPTHEVFIFWNGNLAVCDMKTEQQVPELQGSWLLDIIKRIKNAGIDPTKVIFNLPDAIHKAEVFETEDGYNWRIINK